jgi:Spy/CpxP family protein refolding chaperone
MLRVQFGIKPTSIVLAVAVAVVACDTAFAQRQGGGRRGGRGGQMDMVGLAANEQVQTELKVTDEQREEIEKIVDAYRNDTRDLFSGLADLSREERAKKSEELEQKRQQLSADAEKKLIPVLKEDQVKRLKEITLQVGGVRGLLRPDVADALKLNDDQKSKIKSALDSERQRMRDAFASAANEDGKSEKRGKRGDAFGKMREIRQQTEDEVKKVLTEEQQKQLETMKGPKFELQFQGRQRRGEKAGT